MALARLTRHEILKEDRFMLTLEEIRDFYLAKQKGILLGIAGCGLAALLTFGASYYSAHQNEKAKDELSKALKIYHAPITVSVPEQNPGSTSELSFPNSNERFEKALAEFQKIIASHASGPVGKIAKYYAGLCLRELNKNGEAIALLEPLSKEKSDYGALALVALASVYESSGNLTKAAEVYQQIVNSWSPIAPKNVSLMHLAQLYEQENKSSEATKIYQQIIKEFPGTSYTSEAEQKLRQISR